MVESVIGILQQSAAVLFSIFLLYLVQKWITTTNLSESGIQIVLQEAKLLQREARQHSLEILASVDRCDRFETSLVFESTNDWEQSNSQVSQTCCNDFKYYQSG